MAPAAAPILLISDLHLEEARPELTRAFLGFLEGPARAAAALYILGDFFNVWIGDDGADDLAAKVAAALTNLAASGVPVRIMHGNRDFLIGEDYARRCGAELIHEPHLLKAHGRRYLLMHGDVLCTRDLPYMQFRAMVRDPAWQAGFLGQPLEQRRAFAAQARAQSKSMNSNRAEDITDVSPEEVERVLREQGVDTLIHGHTHRPGQHAFSLDGEPVRRFVLGDWDRRGWYLRLDDAGEELVDFPFR